MPDEKDPVGSLLSSEWVIIYMLMCINGTGSLSLQVLQCRFTLILKQVIYCAHAWKPRWTPAGWNLFESHHHFISQLFCVLGGSTPRLSETKVSPTTLSNEVVLSASLSDEDKWAHLKNNQPTWNQCVFLDYPPFITVRVLALPLFSGKWFCLETKEMMDLCCSSI